MTLQRRTFLLAGTAGAGLVLTGCMEAAPANLSVRAQAQPGMNPGPGGGDRPVTIQVMQMKSAGAFDAADYYALQDPSAAIGGDLVRADQIVLAGGGSASKVITMQPGASVIGVTAGFRSPAGKTVRAKIAAPSADQGLVITVGPGGIRLSTA